MLGGNPEILAYAAALPTQLQKGAHMLSYKHIFVSAFGHCGPCFAADPPPTTKYTLATNGPAL